MRTHLLTLSEEKRIFGTNETSMETIKTDTIEQYNRFFGFHTQHPLVSVVHFDRSEGQPAEQAYRMTFGFYALFLKKTVGCTINYGKTKYDYDDETVVCFAPGQTIGVQSIEGGPVPEADALLFHPDFLHRTPLAQKIRQYTFFSYASNEALHLSVDERLIIQDYMGKIARELEHPIDKFSKPLIISNIEVLLNYCMRFYERQFITREELNNDVLVRFEQLLDDYWDSGMAQLHGLPTVKYFADKVCLSPNYFGDLVKSETGRTAREHIQLKIVERAKNGVKHEADCRHARLPVPAAFPALLQERSRMHAQGIPRPERQDCGIVILAFLPVNTYSTLGGPVHNIIKTETAALSYAELLLYLKYFMR